MVNVYPITGKVWYRESTDEWVLELEGSINDTHFISRHTEPGNTAPEDVAGLPSLYKKETDETKLAKAMEDRDHWSDVAGREGVCMTCRGPNGAPEPYGCTDCLNTGYCGEHHNTVADLEAKLAKAVEALRFYAWENEMRLPSDGPWGAGSTDFGKIARAAVAEIKGESHE